MQRCFDKVPFVICRGQKRLFEKTSCEGEGPFFLPMSVEKTAITQAFSFMCIVSPNPSMEISCVCKWVGEEI